MGEQGSGRRRAAWGALAIAAVAVGAAFTGAGPAVPASAVASASAVTTTPLLSARRLPGWIEGSVAAQRLRRSLGAVLPPLAAGSGCLVVDEAGAALYAWNPLAELAPASNEKLLTATAAVDRLGASHRFVTEVAGSRPVAGVVRGNLYLVGGGDPYLRTPAYASLYGPTEPLYTSLAGLALAVRRAGVTKVTGSVVGDDARYDALRIVPTWTEGGAAPLSALDVNDGTAPVLPPGPGPAPVASGDPVVRAAATFAGLLQADGVAVAGPPAAGAPPAGARVLATVASPSLAQELGQMLTVSDNTAAELFTKELGYQAARNGSTAAGVAAIRSDLAADGLPVVDFGGHDGSGLDRGDRVTCRLLAAALTRLGPASVVARGLPVAGRTGTLADRMLGTPAVGRVVAKTGTLSDVAALSGFVLPAPHRPAVPGSLLGQPLTFALVLNGVPGDTTGRQIVDAIAVALAGYPQIPPLTAIGPQR